MRTGHDAADGPDRERNGPGGRSEVPGGGGETRGAPREAKGAGDVEGAADDAYWRQEFADRHYTRPDQGYEHYRPAYRYGWEARRAHGGRPFEEVEPELRESWDAASQGLDWDEALPAVRDAYRHVDATRFSDPGNPLA